MCCVCFSEYWRNYRLKSIDTSRQILTVRWGNIALVILIGGIKNWEQKQEEQGNKKSMFPFPLPGFTIPILCLLLVESNKAPAGKEEMSFADLSPFIHTKQSIQSVGFELRENTLVDRILFYFLKLLWNC